MAPEKKNSIVEYRTAEAFRKGGYSARKEDYDLQSLIILALGEKENAQEEVLGMLDTVFGTIKDRDMVRTLKDDYDIDLAPETIKEADTMCNLSEGFIDRGIEIGLIKGRTEESEKTARLMLEDGMDPQKVSKYSGLSLEEVQKLASNT
ncbi:MAG: hypothetical protein J6X41_00310 [Spirochaetales bacterium]|nr:hypothetical protein [Spirochaetales bacterium]